MTHPLLWQLRRLGVRVSLRGGCIEFDAPIGAVPPTLRAKLQAQKPALLRALRAESGQLCFGYAETERAAILEFEANVRRSEADRAVAEHATAAVTKVLANRLVMAAEHLLNASVVEVRLPDGALWKAPLESNEPEQPRPSARPASEAARLVRDPRQSESLPQCSAPSAASDSRPARLKWREKVAVRKAQRRAEHATALALQRHLGSIHGSRR